MQVLFLVQYYYIFLRMRRFEVARACSPSVPVHFFTTLDFYTYNNGSELLNCIYHINL